MKSGTLHVYAVNGPKTELATFEEIQGENFRTDESTGKPVYFSRKYVGAYAGLELRTNAETDEQYYAPVLSEEFMIKQQVIKDSMQSFTPSKVAEKEDADLD